MVDPTTRSLSLVTSAATIRPTMLRNMRGEPTVGSHKRSFFAVFCAGVVLFFCQAFVRGAGVTIITHGFNGNVTDWIIPMANRIPQYNLFPGSEFSCYELTVGSDYSVTQSRIEGVSPMVSDSGEIVIKLDWSALAVGIGNSTTDIADAVVPQLLSASFVPELGGRSLT